jgi:hypothetical protein
MLSDFGAHWSHSPIFVSRRMTRCETSYFNHRLCASGISHCESAKQERIEIKSGSLFSIIFCRLTCNEIRRHHHLGSGSLSRSKSKAATCCTIYNQYDCNELYYSYWLVSVDSSARCTLATNSLFDYVSNCFPTVIVGKGLANSSHRPTKHTQNGARLLQFLRRSLLAATWWSRKIVNREKQLFV